MYLPLIAKGQLDARTIARMVIEGASPADFRVLFTDQRQAPKHPIPTPKPTQPSLVGDGWMVDAFRAAGMLGTQTQRGDYLVRCPWEQTHSDGQAYDGSTIVFPSRGIGGSNIGVFHCHHSHCQMGGRGLRELRDALPREAVAAADRLHPREPASPAQQPTSSTDSKPGLDRPADPPKPARKKLVAKSLRELGYDLRTPLPPRKWLVKRARDGFLPSGRVGILAAPGGSGKSMLLAQLAVAVASGRQWVGHDIHERGNGIVLAAMGEEEEDEVVRRMMRACNTDEITLDLRESILDCTRIIAGMGMDLRFVGRDGEPSDVFYEFAERIREQSPTLVILDPLSRFAGPETETDNAQATRFIAMIESLSGICGSTILLSHHSTKGSEGGRSQVRGAGALTDGGRMAIGLEAIRAGPVQGGRLQFIKGNYGPWLPDYYLVQSQERGCEGCWVAANEACATQLKQAYWEERKKGRWK